MENAEPHHPPPHLSSEGEALEEARRQLALFERRIEVEQALERVRARTMRMRSSSELADTAIVLFEQLSDLEIEIRRCGFAIIDGITSTLEIWGTSTTAQGTALNVVGQLHAHQHPVFQHAVEAWRRQEVFSMTQLHGEDLQGYYQAIMQGLTIPQEVQDQVLSVARSEYYHFFSFEQGVVYAFLSRPLTEDERQVISRFARVFELAYTRFLDLKKVEEQAREAQIEAALERVRSKAMAMHSSDDLSSAAIVVFTELRKLGIQFIRGGVGLLTNESRKTTLYSATESDEGDNLSLLGWAMLQDHPVLAEIYDSWVRHKDYFPVLKGDLLRTYYEQILSSFTVPGSHYKKNLPAKALTETPSDYTQYGHFIAFSNGFFYGWAEKPIGDDAINILRRFASVIDLTFKRYFDLQKAEEQAREAVEQASLDRVRAEIASMRTADDLQRITPLVWRELTTLGVPFFRCGVFIVDEAARIVHTYLSKPDGTSLAALHLPFESMSLAREVVAHWRRRQVYTDQWDRTQFGALVATLVEQGHLDDTEAYQGGEEPPEMLALHFLPFTQGMLYVGSAAPLADEQINLVQALADAFSVAYARYEDFRALEAKNEEVERAMRDLKATQNQLIHSEKMASLGQMTAGIAHEIKNPLNFVNNFAEMAVEMADELTEELDQHPDKTVAQIRDDLGEILDDLRFNARKINEHGRRADSIVRAMMQHARGGEGERRLMEVNALVEEYVSLAYHGMRASSPELSVGVERDYDEGVGSVEMVPQEIGRVFINLLSNAFYAVHEKAASAPAAYAPTVTVSTRHTGETVEIRIEDNGRGIDRALSKKIFEPFFTTKPTGSGTGLGLSLSYDIVTQGHGGTLTVESEEGQGATFIITLPTDSST